MSIGTPEMTPHCQGCSRNSDNLYDIEENPRTLPGSDVTSRQNILSLDTATHISWHLLVWR